MSKMGLYFCARFILSQAYGDAITSNSHLRKEHTKFCYKTDKPQVFKALRNLRHIHLERKLQENK